MYKPRAMALWLDNVPHSPCWASFLGQTLHPPSLVMKERDPLAKLAEQGPWCTYNQVTSRWMRGRSLASKREADDDMPTGIDGSVLETTRSQDLCWTGSVQRIISTGSRHYAGVARSNLTVPLGRVPLNHYGDMRSS